MFWSPGQGVLTWGCACRFSPDPSPFRRFALKQRSARVKARFPSPGQHGNGKRISLPSAGFGSAVTLLSFASLVFLFVYSFVLLCALLALLCAGFGRVTVSRAALLFALVFFSLICV